MFDRSIFFPAFKAAGLMDTAQFTLGGVTVIPDITVGYRQPGEVEFDGVASTDYTVEYQTAQVPGLALGDLVTVRGRSFRVMAPPLSVSDGYFHKARLTPA